jgi:uncharacterized protein (TIGR00725 family)
MEAASRGARSSTRWSAGAVLGILPGWDPDAANPYVDVALPTGLDHARNYLVGQADAVIAISGEFGTLSEIALALNKSPKVAYEPARPGEVTRYVADISKARELLGYDPRTPLTGGIPLAIRWQREIGALKI